MRAWTEDVVLNLLSWSIPCIVLQQLYKLLLVIMFAQEL